MKIMGDALYGMDRKNFYIYETCKDERRSIFFL